MRKHSFLVLVLVCTQLGFSVPASAQSESISDANIDLAKHQDWAVQCRKNQDGSLSSCFMFQRILLQDSADSLLQMTIDKPEDLSAPRAIIKIPLGTYLQPGISIDIDSKSPRNLDIEYCDKQGCYAALLLEAEILNLFKRSRLISVVFQNRSRQQIKLPISLEGFTSALTAIK